MRRVQIVFFGVHVGVLHDENDPSVQVMLLGPIICMSTFQIARNNDRGVEDRGSHSKDVSR